MENARVETLLAMPGVEGRATGPTRTEGERMGLFQTKSDAQFRSSSRRLIVVASVKRGAMSARQERTYVRPAKEDLRPPGKRGHVLREDTRGGVSRLRG